MTGKALIDNAIAFYDNVDPDDFDNAGRRARLVRYAQQVYNYIWNFREWSWTYEEDTTTIDPPDAVTDLPDDFMEWGKNGSLFDTDRHIRLSEVSKLVLERRFREFTNGSINMPIFSVWANQIHIPYAVTDTLNLTLFYRFIPDVIDDTDDTNELTIPDRYMTTVVQPGLVSLTQLSKEDARDDWKGLFRASSLDNCVSETSPGCTTVVM